MANFHIRVYAYLHIPNGMVRGAPSTRYNISIVKNEGVGEPITKQIGGDLNKEEAERDIAIWSALLDCPVRYFKEKRVVTVTEEETDQLPRVDGRYSNV